MKSKAVNSEYSLISEEKLSLSGKALIELIQATFLKEASFRFQVKGFSMSPFIRDGDVVTISPLSCLPVSLGRSVAFVHPQTEKLVIHRVVAKNSHDCLIKGDNVFLPDGFIPQENILGTVSKIERNRRKIFFGQGRERLLLAFLSKRALLTFGLWSFRKIVPLPLKNILKRIL